ncbi:MAG TPA: homoserine kinase [Mycobacteriales bacterium]|nr:homoserine kinase [Mycobacteriales bacterium]
MAPRPLFRAAPVRVRVPATSANLGPGFDALGLALARYDDVVVKVADEGLHIDVAGEGADVVPKSERHLVVRSLRAGFELFGGQPRGLELVCANRIPHGRGLGSSAAAIVAGLMAARALVPGAPDLLDDTGLLRRATELEGHPDNVAACLYGGLTVAWLDDAGPGVTGAGARAARLRPAVGLRPVAFIPPNRASTAKVRTLLPESVPHADAARNAGRAALLTHALTVAPDLLYAGTQDWLHQPYRAPAMPKSAALVTRLRGSGVPAVISGAGPAVLAFAPDGVDLATYTPKGWEAHELPIDTTGAQVLPLS